MNIIRKFLGKITPTYYKHKLFFYYESVFAKKIINRWKKAKPRQVIPPHAWKQKVIFSYGEVFNLNILIETGTFLGDMLIACKDYFRELISIEISDYCYTLSSIRCKKFKNIKLFRGDSALILPNILKELKEPVLFWLDGHYSGGITSKSELKSPIMIMNELKAIFESKIKGLRNVILIDDAIGFDGNDGYPTIEELTRFINSYELGYILESRDNIIRITKNI